MNIAQAYFFRSTTKYLARELPALALIGLVKYLPLTSSLKSLLRSISGVTGTPSILQHQTPHGPSSSSLTAFRLTTPYLSLCCRSGWISVTMHNVSFGNMQSRLTLTMSPILNSSGLIIAFLLIFLLNILAVLLPFGVVDVAYNLEGLHFLSLYIIKYAV